MIMKKKHVENEDKGPYLSKIDKQMLSLLSNNNLFCTHGKFKHVTRTNKDESTLVAQRALHLANSEMKTNSQE